MHPWHSSEERDAYFMRLALVAARHAYDAGEVPVGAVVVYRDEVVATGFNQPIALHDASAHAEMQALRAAGLTLKNYRLPECELFVTLEPCLMCAGAMMHARLSRVVFATHDYKTGVAGSVLDVFDNARLNHHAQVTGGVLAQEARELLQLFFRERRQLAKKP
ncbi:tRNA adenosine(34) deaminase TadA [Hydromonas duriensis]|uniref:tRNA-specific adenosine deaminase n=1 Tax=Hydromonas duriensis TaxID=1527608 RepID=A0A4R6YBI5_9BURK|nr:tRNA adenosine(34) deaminase TadA [Hydromonas duriensis]TDR33005.1 tRNA-adenosine deaminase [Hydromonas duriensis]